MTVQDLLKQINKGNARAAGKLYDFLKFKKLMTYKEIYSFINKRTNVSLPDWDALLAEAEDLEKE